jgi:hypothetical protein
MATEVKAKDAKPAKAKAERTPTFVQFLKARGIKGAATKEAIVDGAIADALKQGVTRNSKGKLMTKENGLSLLNAMSRDIRNGKKGWWSGFTVVETETLFQFRAKQ